MKPYLTDLQREAKKYKPNKDVLDRSLRGVFRDFIQPFVSVYMPVYYIQKGWETQVKTGE